MQWASPYLSREDGLNNILCTACVGDVGGGARFIEDDARHERRWVEEGEVVAEHGETCDVRIVSDGEVCKGCSRRHVRPIAAAEQRPTARRPKAKTKAVPAEEE